MVAFAALLSLLVAGDAATTAYALSLGGVEANPLGPTLGLAVKVVLTICTFLLVGIQVPRWRALTALPGVLALSLPVVWNVTLLASSAIR
jgi:hypothetical protein